MTGTAMFDKAMEILGYSSSNGISGKRELLKRALTVINQIYSDIYFTENTAGFIPLNNITENIILPERELNDIMPYGVAMMLAQSEGDGDNQQMYSVIYNKKRTSLTKTRNVVDVLPRGWY